MQIIVPPDPRAVIDVPLDPSGTLLSDEALARLSLLLDMRIRFGWSILIVVSYWLVPQGVMCIVLSECSHPTGKVLKGPQEIRPTNGPFGLILFEEDVHG